MKESPLWRRIGLPTLYLPSWMQKVVPGDSEAATAERLSPGETLVPVHSIALLVASLVSLAALCDGEWGSEVVVLGEWYQERRKALTAQTIASTASPAIVVLNTSKDVLCWDTSILSSRTYIGYLKSRVRVCEAVIPPNSGESGILQRSFE
jgi:hypothetical protein